MTFARDCACGYESAAQFGHATQFVSCVGINNSEHDEIETMSFAGVPAKQVISKMPPALPDGRPEGSF